ncbi:MAG: UDP-4-amino-4,6-dideoxy-N-acetyl-beta-L-altrosamine transaminase [Desulfobacula sp.]|nr:UDP-4-amino-4,6-dideoxy-N-acetyl-beta-L-altrosamine transaminase [Desulfobacula sp.]
MKSNTEDKKYFLPYGRHRIDEEDLKAVRDVLLSDWLTTGPKVEEFEQDVAKTANVKFGGAVNSGTAALHAAMNAINIKPGDEVILTPMTFAATANAVVYQGGIPVFADVDPETLLIDPRKVEEKISSKTRAVIAVDYAGQMCDYDALNEITKKYGLYLIADACHSIGGSYKGFPSGSCADLTVFSFHPVKHITTGEGGMVVTDKKELIHRVKLFRNHGINTDLHQRKKMDSWYYEIKELGFNYRMTDFQCALGISQLKKLNSWIHKRNLIAKEYDRFFEGIKGVSPLKTESSVSHAYHIYVVKLNTELLKRNRQEVFSFLRNKGIGVNVHYIPVHYHPFYKNKFNTAKGLCPITEEVYERILTIPLFPGMVQEDVKKVCSAVKDAVQS